MSNEVNNEAPESAADFSPSDSEELNRDVTAMPDPPMTPIEKARAAAAALRDDPDFQARQKRRLTIAEYEEAKLMRQRDGVTVKEIAEKFEVTVGNLSKRFKKDGIVKGELSQLHRRAIERRSVERAAARADEIVSILMTNEEIASKGITLLERHIMQLFGESQKRNRPFGQYMQDVKALKIAIEALKLGGNFAREVIAHYDKRDEQTLPELPVMVMDEQAVAEMRRREDEERAFLGLADADIEEVEEEEYEDSEDDDDDIVVEES